MTWEVERAAGRAAAFHARAFPEPPRRLVSVLAVDRPALVLGSTQPGSDADAAALDAAGVELVRRRSGGGAVLLEPDRSLWVDVFVPAGDPLWDDDVGRAFHWLGDAWAAALRDLGVPAEVHRGGMVDSRWSRLVCFAGLGPGEVLTGGRKVVGISQRRTRAGARFQSVLLRRWDPSPMADLLVLDDAARRRVVDDLADAATGVDRPPADVVEALLHHLPAIA